MKNVLIALAAFAAFQAGAITATKEYVDRRDAENRAAVSNEIADVVAAIPSPSLEPATNYTDAAVAAATAGLVGYSTFTQDVSYVVTGKWAQVGTDSWTIWARMIGDGTWYDGDEFGMRVDYFAEGWGDDGAGWYLWADNMMDYYFIGDMASAAGGTFQVDMHEGETDEGDPLFETYEVICERIRNRINPLGLVTQPELAAVLNAIPHIDTSLFATKTALAAVSNESALITRLYTSSNVIDEVTNYNSIARLPIRRMYQLTESNEYVKVWDEMAQHTNTLGKAFDYIDGATGTLAAATAPRAWSRVTSGYGVEAPAGTTWISTPDTVIAGGYEYEKHATSGGAVWILTSRGAAYDFSPSTNNTAYLNIAATDGTPIFRIEKTDSYLLGVDATGVSVEGSTLVVNVGIVAANHPFARVCSDIAAHQWEKEEDGISAGLATIAWSGTSGNYVCRITNTSGGNSIFAYFEYLQEGGVKVVNEGALDVTGGILCTDGVHKVRPVWNNGTVTWTEVP